MREIATKLFKQRQKEIITALEQIDGGKKFIADNWERPGGGGGKTCILSDGAIFEQAGVNFSEVHGKLPLEMSKTLVDSNTEESFFACGVSLVIHPLSPMIPTTHANFRYLEVKDKKWFGGGMDLTPYYLFKEDAKHFHQIIKETCDKHNSSFYPDFKNQCDEYFYLPHREEARGIGGIFFDYLGKEDAQQLDSLFSYVTDISNVFIQAYLPIVQKRRDLMFTDAQKEFQLIRRGRYVEFNLVYDRGTLFGLKTGGRTESILMSLPPQVNWEYNYQPEPGSKEEELINIVKSPKGWV